MEKSESSMEPLPPPSQGNYISILSIDGGGIRGLIPAVMLEYLETQLQDPEQSKEARLADYFDVITGTSTGGLIAGMPTTPKQDTRHPPFAAQEIIEFYPEQSPKIFPQFESGCYVPIISRLYSKFQSALRFVRSCFWGPKYDGKYLHQKAEELLGGTVLNDTLTNVVIPTFDIKKFQPVIFSSYLVNYEQLIILHFLSYSKGKSDSDTGLSKLSDVCIASSAAPTYLPSHYCKTQSEEFNCIDGGMAANDPVLMGGSSDMVDYHIQVVFETLESKGHYLRVQNLTDILKFGKAMLDKPVSGMDTVQLKLTRSTQKRDTTCGAALRRYAELLYDERRSRIEEKNSTSLNQSFE